MRISWWRRLIEKCSRWRDFEGWIMQTVCLFLVIHGTFKISIISSCTQTFRSRIHAPYSSKISPIRHSCLAIYPNNEVLRDCRAIYVDIIFQYLLSLFILCLYILYIFLSVQNHFTLLCKILFSKKEGNLLKPFSFCSSSYDDA